MAQTPDPTPTASPSPTVKAEISSTAKAEVEEKVTELLTQKAYVPTVDFALWPGFLKGEQAKLDAAKTEDEFSADMNEALTKFGASHIYLASPKAAESRRSGSTVGIGVSQTTNPDGTVLITRTIAGAAADKAGLVAGDTITQVDGKKADGVNGIRGEENTTVKITVKHANGKTGEYTLTRTKFSTVRQEEFTEVDKDTAKISVYTFDWTYNRDRVEELMKKAKPYKNLILDLRDNGGGAVVNLQHLLGFFLTPDESIGTFVKKELVNSYVRQTGGKPGDVQKIAEWSRNQDEWDFQQIKAFHAPAEARYKGHVVVLINGFSGSASEIAAAALHDLDKAELVGQKSAGAVLVSVIQPASNRFSLQYPIMDYVTVRGVRLEGNGLVPAVSTTEIRGKFNEPDEAVTKAMALFNRERLRDERDPQTSIH